MRSFVLDSTYDDEVDAGYIAFDEIAPGEAVTQVIVENDAIGPLSVVLDLDANGKLLGIELLGVTALVARPRITPPA